MIKVSRLLSLLGFLFGLWVLMGGTAIASIHKYPEGEGHTLLRSLQTLRETAHRKGQGDEPAWQVVLFKRMGEGQTESVHLRLVGFPGGAVFEHPKPLYLMGSQKTWTAIDVVGDTSPFPPNVGEYDVLDALTQLNSNAPLVLQLSTQTGKRELIVPPFAVKEWRQVMAAE